MVGWMVDSSPFWKAGGNIDQWGGQITDQLHGLANTFQESRVLRQDSKTEITWWRVAASCEILDIFL